MSTQPIDQAPFAAAEARLGGERMRCDVLAGGFRLREADAATDDRVLIAAAGAVVPFALRAAC